MMRIFMPHAACLPMPPHLLHYKYPLSQEISSLFQDPLFDAPARLGPLGTLFIESKRHFLDYAEMTDEESDSLGGVMRRVYHVLKPHTMAERIYQVTLIDGIPHFHSWLVPHRKEDPVLILINIPAGRSGFLSLMLAAEKAIHDIYQMTPS